MVSTILLGVHGRVYTEILLCLLHTKNWSSQSLDVKMLKKWSHVRQQCFDTPITNPRSCYCKKRKWGPDKWQGICLTCRCCNICISLVSPRVRRLFVNAGRRLARQALQCRAPWSAQHMPNCRKSWWHYSNFSLRAPISASSPVCLCFASLTFLSLMADTPFSRNSYRARLERGWSTKRLHPCCWLEEKYSWSQ